MSAKEYCCARFGWAVKGDGDFYSNGYVPRIHPTGNGYWSVRFPESSNVLSNISFCPYCGKRPLDSEGKE